MAVSLSIVRRTNTASGGAEILYSDGTGISLPDAAALADYVNIPQLEAEVMPDILRRILAGYSARNGNVLNKDATFNIDQPSGNVVRIQ